jgi:hypothetical protein
VAAPVQPGSSDRFWREVEALSRLDVTLRRTEGLPEDERQSIAASAEVLKNKLTALALRLEAEAAALSGAPAAPPSTASALESRPEEAQSL